MLKKARKFALKAHGDQLYGDRPYSYHLDSVAKILENYSEEAKVVAYLHDVVEDTSVKIDQVEQLFGKFIADCVTILTDEPGSNRVERKIQTYSKMSKVSGKETLALIVKAADRLANMEACVEDGNFEKLDMYKKEHEDFSKAVFRNDLCDNIWEKINKIHKT